MSIDFRPAGAGSTDKARQDVDFLTKFESKIAVDMDKLEEPLKTIARFLEQKERLEHERTAMIKLLEMSANLQRELFETNKRCAIILDHAKVHWPGRDSAKLELTKCKARKDQVNFTLSHIEQAITKMNPLPELAQKLIELESEIAGKGGDRMLINIESALKKSMIQRGDLLEIAKSLRPSF
jgi:hypothetical protein